MLFIAITKYLIKQTSTIWGKEQVTMKLFYGHLCRLNLRSTSRTTRISV